MFRPFHQIDCFKRNILSWKVIGLSYSKNRSKTYKCYSWIFMTLVNVGLLLCMTANIFYMEKNLNHVIESLILYLTVVAAFVKIVVFFMKRESISNILCMLEKEIFQGDETFTIIKEAKAFIVRLWNVIAVVSFTSHLVNVIQPLVIHLFLGNPLSFPVSEYSFLPMKYKSNYKYVIYAQQVLSMHAMVHVNVSVDTFAQGAMCLAIAQLDLLNEKLLKINTETKDNKKLSEEDHENIISKLKECIIHYVEIVKYCLEIQKLFSVVIFVQFSVSSVIICVSLYRFTLPLDTGYCIFISTYISGMVAQILLPCWFGTEIIHKSGKLVFSAYSCQWFPCSRKFKSSLLIFIIRANKPIAIVGGKMFELSLNTFTGIMNSAYSFFTLLQNLQNS